MDQIGTIIAYTKKAENSSIRIADADKTDIADIDGIKNSNTGLVDVNRANKLGIAIKKVLQIQRKNLSIEIKEAISSNKQQKYQQ